MEGWTEFFLGEVGAAAALAGLLVVAISINIAKIVSFPLLPGRAAQTLIMVGAALVISSFALFPGQPLWVFGLECLGASLVVAGSGAVQFRQARDQRAKGAPLPWTVIPLLMIALCSLPGIVGGLTLVAGAEAGVYWVAVGVILGLVTTLINGWVLLIEILR